MAEQMNQNQNADPAAGQGTGEKTFTQDDVNRIVQERLAKENEKYEKQISDMQAEMKKHEKMLEAKERLREAKISEDFLDLVKFDSEESFNHSLGLLERVTMKPTVRYSPRRGDAHYGDDIREAMGLNIL